VSLLGSRLGHRLTGLIMIIAIALITGCDRSAAKSDSEDSASAQPSVMMAVSGARVSRAPMSAELSLLGTTVAQRHITLRAPSAGQVVGLTLQSGDRVTQGEIVAHIINREAEAAQNGLNVARSLDPADAKMLAAAVKRHSGSAAIAVTAPENAIVAQRLVSSGQMVADLDPIVDMIDPKSIYIEAAVPIENLGEIRPGMPAVVVSPIRPGVKYPARVAALSPSFNQGGATAPARIEFIGPTLIKQAGAPAQIRVTTSYVPDAIVIPTVALFEDASTRSRYVFVVGPDGIAHRTTVTIGISSGTLTQITSGLAVGQTIITSGGYAVSDGLHVTVALAK
jgi:multidrug efflux pump subunit AcrA (membrane-fusion protein)